MNKKTKNKIQALANKNERATEDFRDLLTELGDEFEEILFKAVDSFRAVERKIITKSDKLINQIQDRDEQITNLVGEKLTVPYSK